jgi:hypothetical protein
MAMSESISYGTESTEMAAYCEEGTARALGLGNRGPIRWNSNGQLHPDILDAYRAVGFYVFTDVLDKAELDDLERDLHDVLARAPTSRHSNVDVLNRPALGSELQGKNLGWVAPLSDPLGGTQRSAGRHPV